jgi:hypothetical protein
MTTTLLVEDGQPFAVDRGFTAADLRGLEHRHRHRDRERAGYVHRPRDREQAVGQAWPRRVHRRPGPGPRLPGPAHPQAPTSPQGTEPT